VNDKVWTLGDVSERCDEKSDCFELCLARRHSARDKVTRVKHCGVNCDSSAIRRLERRDTRV